MISEFVGAHVARHVGAFLYDGLLSVVYLACELFECLIVTDYVSNAAKA